MHYLERRIVLITLLWLAILCASCGRNTGLMHNTIPDVTSQSNDLYYTSSEGLFEFTAHLGEVRIDCVSFCDKTVVVPERIHNLEVTEIGVSAFYQNKCVSVKLPSTLRSIQASAFYRCYYIKEITIPAKTAFIDGNPFFRCSGLEDVYVQPGNTHYRDINGVLYDSTGTTLIAYPEGRKQTVYEIPCGVLKIADEAFGYSTCLETVIIPESVVAFPDYNLFERCEDITLVVVQGSAAAEYGARYDINLVYSSAD